MLPWQRLIIWLSSASSENTSSCIIHTLNTRFHDPSTFPRILVISLSLSHSFSLLLDCSRFQTRTRQTGDVFSQRSRFTNADLPQWPEKMQVSTFMTLLKQLKKFECLLGPKNFIFQIIRCALTVRRRPEQELKSGKKAAK